MFGSWFVMQYLVSFLVLQSSHWGRDSWLLYFHCLLDVIWLSCSVSLRLRLPSMGWSTRLVIVAFPGHTHLLFYFSLII